MQFLKGSLIENSIVGTISGSCFQLTGGIIYIKIGPKYSFMISFFISGVGAALLMIFWQNKDLVPFFLSVA